LILPPQSVSLLYRADIITTSYVISFRQDENLIDNLIVVDFAFNDGTIGLSFIPDFEDPIDFVERDIFD